MARFPKNIFARLRGRTGKAPNRETLPKSRLRTRARVRDRGAAKYFHGRSAILKDFHDERNTALVGLDGTIFLVQGAPGAGKTALLNECAMRAAADEWRVAEIETDALHDPAALAAQLGEPYADRKVFSRESTAGVRLGGVIAEGRAGEADRYTKEFSGASVDTLLRAAAEPSGLVLVLDEVQRLKTAVDKSYQERVEITLNRIHNGKVGAPVILLAGGLGNSQDVIAEFGISRFEGGCLVRLGRLAPEAERAVIRDWLTKDGGVNEVDDELERWSAAIAAESHGWPQHVMSFLKPSVGRLLADGGRVSDQGLSAILAEGRRSRMEYHASRMNGIDHADRVTLANLLVQYGDVIGLGQSELVSALSRGKMLEQGCATFSEALHNGVIVENARGHFVVPIPSMRTWLVAEYADHARALSPLPTPAESYIRNPEGVRTRHVNGGPNNSRVRSNRPPVGEFRAIERRKGQDPTRSPAPATGYRQALAYLQALPASSLEPLLRTQSQSSAPKKRTVFDLLNSPGIRIVDENSDLFRDRASAGFRGRIRSDGHRRSRPLRR